MIDDTPSLKVLVYDGDDKDIKAGALDKIKQAHNGDVQVYKFDDFLKLGQDNLVEPNHPQPDDIACLMYTSGSTGPPKGVQITNANIVACCGAVQSLIPHVIKEGETYIAYLPLAHIMEFAVEMCVMYVGAEVGYGNVKTLTDASVRVSRTQRSAHFTIIYILLNGMQNCRGDIATLRPTIMVGVPAVWELIRKGILAKVKAGGAIKSAVFNGAVSAKKFFGRGSIIGKVTDSVVFSAVAAGTGGRLKYAMSGGAGISKETQEFLSTALVMIIQGYGSTESTAMCALLPPEYHSYGTVGVPVPSVEIKLVDVADAGYSSKNSTPQGEIWIRGPSVTKGYYKNDEETKAAYTDDGWFKTGDVGQWNPNGTLSVIDRKKNLVKLAGGEYIALERLETIYRSSQYVQNIMIYATSEANKPMAVIFAHEANLKELHSLAGNDAGDFEAVCKNKAVRDAVLKDLNAVGKKAGLKPLETLQTVVVSSEEWTPANGLLTAAQKLQRKDLVKHYKKEIDVSSPSRGSGRAQRLGG